MTGDILVKIAVMADIHSNLIAFKGVIDRISKLNIDQIIVAGDIVSDCPSPNEVIDLIIKNKIICVKGNREEYLMNPLCDSDWHKYLQYSSIVWTKQKLTKENIEWISNLPFDRVIDIPGTDKIRVVHGSPFKTTEHLYPYKTERLIECLDSIEEKVLVCGHSHIPWNLKINNKLVVNPGAVGVSFNKSVAADFVILEWKENQWIPEHISVPYDLELLKSDFIESGLFDNGIWGHLILESLSKGRNCNIEFIEMANKLKSESIHKNENFIPNEIWVETCKRWTGGEKSINY